MSSRKTKHSDATVGGKPSKIRPDAANVAGLTKLMNMQNVRPGMNLETAENLVMGKKFTGTKPGGIDPVELYDKEIASIALELGIDLLESEDPARLKKPAEDPPATSNPPLGTSDRGPPLGTGRSRPVKPSISRRPVTGGKPTPVSNPLMKDSIEALIGDLGLENELIEPKKSEGPSHAGTPVSPVRPPDPDSDDDSGTSSSGDDSSDSMSTDSDSESAQNGEIVLSEMEKDLGIDRDVARLHSNRRQQVQPIPGAGDHKKTRLKTLTEEQERRRHINAVMGDMRKETHTSFGMEHERTQDVKASKLEQISRLRINLQEEGIECSMVGDPTMASSIQEIDSVLSILKLKNDRIRYSSMAEEIILGVAEGIGTVLDGTREIPLVGWKPDYTGYHNTVNVKLHRMRFETSQVVGDIIEKYNLGPMTRLGLELLPSFFLYPWQRRKQQGTPGIYSDFGKEGVQQARVRDARSAYSAVRKAETPDSLSEISNI